MIQLRVLDRRDAAFHQLLDKKGQEFRQLVEAWNSLSAIEKDTCSHPVYMLDFLKCMEEHSQNAFDLILVYDMNLCVGAIPFDIITFKASFHLLYYLKIPVISCGSPISVKSLYHAELCRKLLEYRFNGYSKPMMLLFVEIENTHPFVDVDIPKIVTLNPSTRKVLEIAQNGGFNDKNNATKYPSTIKKKYKRLASLGSLEFEVIEEREEIKTVYDELVEFESKGWKGRQDKCLRLNHFPRLFYRLLLLDYALTHNAFIAKLTFRGTTVSMFAGIVIDSTLYGLLIAYNEEYANYSPGHLLYYHMFQHYLPEKGITRYDSLFNSDWFRIWNPEEFTTSKMFLFPNRFLRDSTALILNMKHRH